MDKERNIYESSLIKKRVPKIMLGQLEFVLLFLSYFILLFKFIGDGWFSTDELDIFVIGKGIANGKYLYTDLKSQHMPVSYYISALFDWLGFESVEDQRIAFYLFISVFWTIIVIRYKNVINKWVLILYPVFLCAVLPTYDRGTCILSEHLAGIGAIILLLEYMRYIVSYNINIISCIMLSFAILLTFGTMFWLIYALFFIMLGVLIEEINRFRRGDKKQEFYSFFQRFIPLFVCISIPWVLLIIYYKRIGTLRAFYDGAYLLNVEIYPKYGAVLGGSIVTPFFQMFSVLGSFVVETGSVSDWNYGIILKMILLLGYILWCISKYRKGYHLEAIIIFLYTLALGIRGGFHFHGTQFVEVMCIITVDYLLQDNLWSKCKSFLNNKHIEKKYTVRIVILMLFIVLGLNRISTITSYEVNRDRLSGEAAILHDITEKNEDIWSFTFANDIFMIANRYYEVGYPQVPWEWEMYKDDFEDEIDNPPRVIIYAVDHSVWGYSQNEYAPEIKEFIDGNYTRYGETRIYVRNDYYKELSP